jgi:hypothetical protein
MDFGKAADSAGITRKEAQNIAKQILFGKSITEISEGEQQDASEMSAFAWSVMRAVHEAGKNGDFAGLRAIADFAFEGGKK